MPTLTVETVQGDHATFIEAVLEADRPHRVRIEPDLSGPIWPPRTDGRADEGWDETGLTTEIAAGSTAIGFATSTGPVDGSVDLVRSEPIHDGLPGGVAAWIERIKERLVRAERLERADDLPSATEVLIDLGGLSAAERLAAEIAVDRRIASRLSVVPDGIRKRLEAVEIPVVTLARIAPAGGCETG